MKFNLYYSALNNLSADELIRRLKDRDRTQRHIIITPDKSSLYFERKLFALLNEQSFFDVTTTTLSRFANTKRRFIELTLEVHSGECIVHSCGICYANELK